MQLFHALPSNVSVNLGCRQVTMPEQHLHYTQVSTIVQQMGRKCVAKCMRGKFLTDRRALCIPFYYVPERLAGHAVAAARWEKVVGLTRPENFRSWSRNKFK